MTAVKRPDRTAWRSHAREWRNPFEVIGTAQGFGTVSPQRLSFQVTGDFAGLLDQLKIRLLVSREYEHLVLALGGNRNGMEISYMPLPHPSGIAVDSAKKTVYIAGTRNPNQVFTFRVMSGLLKRKDMDRPVSAPVRRCLVPVESRIYPGSLYLHDLAVMQGRLYANAVAHNSVVELPPGGGFRYAWWPRCAQKKDGTAARDLNYFQLNSIAAGRDLRSSYFTASTDRRARIRPGHVDFQTDGKGVIFSGRTRDVICRGLTRPHSARLYQGNLWVDNSGYGELGVVRDRKYETWAKLPGWTRGLFIHRGVAFVGLSRVIPKFRRYAPGVNTEQSLCAVHAVEIKSGKFLGGIAWPGGNQIFAVEGLARDMADGFPLRTAGRRDPEDAVRIFYAFETKGKAKIL